MICQKKEEDGLEKDQTSKLELLFQFFVIGLNCQRR